MKFLGRLFRIILGVIVIVVIVKLIPRPVAANSDLQTTPSTPPVSDLISQPSGFTSQADQVMPSGTEVKGIGTVDQGFSFVGTEKVEFVTGYTVKIPPAIGPEGFKLQIQKPELILDIILMGLKAVGVNDKQDMPGLNNIGDESVGVTFTTDWNNSRLRVDGVIFRRANVGAVAAVIYVDGQKPSVQIADVSKELDQKIK